MIVDVAPRPALCTDVAGMSMASAKTCSTCSVAIGPFAPTAGIWTLVPPSKSMPKLKPRITIDRMQMISATPKTAYQVFERPTMSMPPLPR